MSDCEVAVIGAGVAGLAAARTLAARGHDVRVLDAGSLPGGVMQSARREGYLVERGPNTMRVSGPALAFLRSLDLVEVLRGAAPASRKRFLVRQGRLEPVPMNPLGFVRTPLLSTGAKLRLLAEPFRRAGDARGESVHAFVARRLGPEVASALVGPFLTGVYAGDEQRLGAEAVFPSLVDHERRSGSILRGALSAALSARRQTPEARGRAGSWSTADGLGALAAGLAKGLKLQSETRVVALAREPDAGDWRLEIQGPGGEETWHARAVVLATPAPAAGSLLAPLDAEAGAILQGIEYAPVVALALGVDPTTVLRSLEGFGFLVPRGEDLRLLGCLFMSSLFPGRAPSGRALLHCMLGGTRWPEAIETPDDQLEKSARADLDRLLGMRAEPQRLALQRWPQAVPQPGPDHGARIAALRRRADAVGAIVLAGGYLDGVSVADAMLSGVRAGKTLSERLAG